MSAEQPGGMTDEQRQQWKETGLFPIERWPTHDGSTPLVSPMPDRAVLRKIAESIPPHIQASGWYAVAKRDNFQSVYADNFSGMGRQAIASIPSDKRYFGWLPEFIAAACPRTVIRLLDRIDELEAEVKKAKEDRVGVWKEGYDVGRKGGLNAPEMHSNTSMLVMRFSDALRNKLAAAEKKYGYADGWMETDWLDECRRQLVDHVDKGDPLDVAAYCAFLWHHHAATSSRAWNPMATAPRDGTIIRLLVEFEEHQLEDSEEPQHTIGSNSFDNTGVDEWQLVGWCWTHDHFTDGKGKPIGWLPF